MDMEGVKGNKFFWIVIAVTVINLLALGVGTIVIDKTADRVIHKLKKEYSPSPYGPGVDPDKVDPKVFGKQQAILESPIPDEEVIVPVKFSWRDKWEEERGVSPEQ